MWLTILESKKNLCHRNHKSFNYKLLFSFEYISSASHFSGQTQTIWMELEERDNEFAEFDSRKVCEAGGLLVTKWRASINKMFESSYSGIRDFLLLSRINYIFCLTAWLFFTPNSMALGTFKCLSNQPGKGARNVAEYLQKVWERNSDMKSYIVDNSGYCWFPS